MSQLNLKTYPPNFTYLDNASTTKVDDRVLKEMLPYFTEYFGNASSNHSFGKKAKDAIDKSRIQVANLINASPNEIIFTSGATESINLAIKGYIEANTNKGNHIITVKTEHKAVLATCEYLETKGTEVTYLNVDQNGLISIQELQDAIKENTILISVMYVNNETGVIQPIQEIGEIARKHKITFFSDATQAAGKVEIDVENDNIDMLCLSAHKLNGPKGVGILFTRKGIVLTPQMHGGSQESGVRGGTYNTPLIIGLGKACEIAEIEMEGNNFKIKELNNYTRKSIKEIISFKEMSEDIFRVNNIINLIITGLDSDILITKYKLLALSNGSACNAEVMQESHVIKAMLSRENDQNNYIRISLDKNSSKKNIDFLLETLINYLKPNNAK